MLKLRGFKGFTLVEIMIVVAILGLLASLAVPNFLKAAQNMRTNVCIKNMRVIDDAISQWAFENNKNEGDAIVVEEIVDYIKKGALPTCLLEDAAYTINNVDDSPQVECPNYNETTHHAVIK